ncbi:MAG TPA: sucrose synthase [Crinalium sp.]|jgi:sucrose synthase
MNNLIKAVLTSDEALALKEIIHTLSTSDKQYFLKNEILHAFVNYCNQFQKPSHFYHSSSIGKLIQYTHELILDDSHYWFLLRPWLGSQEVWRVSADLTTSEQMSPKALLEVRDRLVHRYQTQILEIDVGPFYKTSPSISDPRSIGQGLPFLNRYLCNEVLADSQYWLDVLFDVLHRHQYDGIPLLINDRIRSGAQLSYRVKQAIKLINQRSPNEPYAAFHASFQELGFEPGWGNTAARVRETLELLKRLIEDPEPAILEAFVSRIPAVFRVVLVSIHGWVGQESVVGRPETTGQVVYVLEQARSLENKLQEELKLAGLDFLGIQPQVIILTRLIPDCEGTLCNQRLEAIEGTKNAWILRIPFQDFNPTVTQRWMSKFEIWPYLEYFALDAERELLTRLGGKPNLIIGNYSDGNLVAFLLARRLKATQCNIAHSLEKPKYLFSNLYWQDLEEQYHFSAQFTADLISMNAADFIITSSYQEIVGSPDSFGQYESYKSFTMPQLYHVIDGIDLFSPKFNRIPPGVNEAVFFPYTQTERRNAGDRNRIHDLLLMQEDPNIWGHLDDVDRRPIFAIGSTHVSKNLSGLVECFGRSKALQERCNLILVTTQLHSQDALNAEEAGELEKLHALIHEYQLDGHIRWLGMPLPNNDLAEAYRVIGDRNGIFVHFARFESFGRVVLEAMVSGLPTFATQFGGVSEIIQEGENGFLINPTDLEETAQKILDFLDECETDGDRWQTISTRAIQRVHEEYNWTIHTNKLLLLSKLYSFWNYINQDSRAALSRYLEALFFLLYKPRAATVLEEHMRR